MQGLIDCLCRETLSRFQILDSTPSMQPMRLPRIQKGLHRGSRIYAILLYNLQSMPLRVQKNSLAELLPKALLKLDSPPCMQSHRAMRFYLWSRIQILRSMHSRIQCACVHVCMCACVKLSVSGYAAFLCIGGGGSTLCTPTTLSLLICLLEFTDMQRNLVLTLAQAFLGRCVFVCVCV